MALTTVPEREPGHAAGVLKVEQPVGARVPHSPVVAEHDDRGTTPFGLGDEF
jgi:hypothetical protein